MNTWSVFSNNTALEVALFCTTGSFVLFAVFLTAYLIFRHVKHWIDPDGQRCIVRILILVPIYSVVSWLAVLFGDYALYFTLVRDCYEAYALHQFFALLEHYLKEEASSLMTIDDADMPDLDTGHLISNYGETPLAAPFCMLTYQPSKRVFMHIKRCSLQYVFVKPVLAFIAILLHILGLYHPGSFSIRHGYFWISMLLFISSTLALYFIFLFFELIKRRIFMYKPLLKLISIKILVFFIFWQSIAIAILYDTHCIPAFFGWSIARSEETVQNVIICIEMAGLSVFNLYAFSYATYRTTPGEHTLDIALETLTSVVNQSDILKETKDAFIPKQLSEKDKHKD